jgi:hypothetical protein
MPRKRPTPEETVSTIFTLSERRVCRVLGQHHSTERGIPTVREDEDRLAELIPHRR